MGSTKALASWKHPHEICDPKASEPIYAVSNSKTEDIYPDTARKDPLRLEGPGPIKYERSIQTHATLWPLSSLGRYPRPRAVHHTHGRSTGKQLPLRWALTSIFPEPSSCLKSQYCSALSLGSEHLNVTLKREHHWNGRSDVFITVDQHPDKCCDYHLKRTKNNDSGSLDVSYCQYCIKKTQVRKKNLDPQGLEPHNTYNPRH